MSKSNTESLKELVNTMPKLAGESVLGRVESTGKKLQGGAEGQEHPEEFFLQAFQTQRVPRDFSLTPSEQEEIVKHAADFRPWIAKALPVLRESHPELVGEVEDFKQRLKEIESSDVLVFLGSSAGADAKGPKADKVIADSRIKQCFLVLVEYQILKQSIEAFV